MFVDNLIEEISITELPNVKIGSSETLKAAPVVLLFCVKTEPLPA